MTHNSHNDARAGRNRATLPRRIHGPSSPVLLLFALALLLPVGCQTAGSRYADRAPIRLASPAEQPLKTSWDYKHEYTYPAHAAFQSFKWDKRGCTWKVSLPDYDDAHACVLFKKSYDFTDEHQQKSIAFQMKPAFMADHLAMGLLDEAEFRDGRIVHTHVVRMDQPLSTFKEGESGDWGYFRIPLDAFDQHTGPYPAPSVGTETCAGIDWSSVRGIQLARTEGEGPEQTVVVKQIKFQGDSEFIPRRYALAK